MIDVINAQMEIPSNDIPNAVFNHSKESFIWHELEFYPKDDHSYRATKSSVQDKGMNNLNFVIRNGQAATLFISNSLHKLCHSGINHTDFTKSQLIDIIDHVDDTMDLNFSNAKLFGRIEYAVNINVENPKLIYNSMIKYKNIHPTPMKSRSKQYGTRFDLASYSIKFYDPIEKMKLEGKPTKQIPRNILRIEIVSNLSYLRKRGINLQHVKDLYNNETLTLLGKSIYNMSNQIEFNPSMPLDLHYSDYQCFYFFAFGKPEELKAFRKSNSATFYRHQKKYKCLLEKHSNIGQNISNNIQDKWLELSTS